MPTVVAGAGVRSTSSRFCTEELLPPDDDHEELGGGLWWRWFSRAQLCTVAEECCMLRSNSSRLIAWPMFSEGSLPAEACASSSGENHRASWLLVGERPPSRP